MFGTQIFLPNIDLRYFFEWLIKIFILLVSQFITLPLFQDLNFIILFIFLIYF